jgi:Ribosomal protein S6
LSYTINKYKKAFYIYFQLETSGSIVKEISKELNQSENLIRYIFIKVKNHQELPTKLNNEKK